MQEKVLLEVAPALVGDDSPDDATISAPSPLHVLASAHQEEIFSLIRSIPSFGSSPREEEYKFERWALICFFYCIHFDPHIYPSSFCSLIYESVRKKFVVAFLSSLFSYCWILLAELAAFIHRYFKCASVSLPLWYPIPFHSVRKWLRHYQQDYMLIDYHLFAEWKCVVTLCGTSSFVEWFRTIELIWNVGDFFASCLLARHQKTILGGWARDRV